MFLLGIMSFTMNGQPLRYFEFKTLCFTNGNNTWQDSSFIAATSDTVLIDSLYADLSRPDTMRKMIIGPVDTGNAGYNHNVSHWFLWHFIENQWTLTQGAVEICDGCPTGVDACVSCFIQIHAYCPWSSYVNREINISGISGSPGINDFFIYPNPGRKIITLETTGVIKGMSLAISNVFGQEVITGRITGHRTLIDISGLPKGSYIVRLKNDKTGFPAKLIVKLDQ